MLAIYRTKGQTARNGMTADREELRAAELTGRIHKAKRHNRRPYQWIRGWKLFTNGSSWRYRRQMDLWASHASSTRHRVRSHSINCSYYLGPLDADADVIPSTSLSELKLCQLSAEHKLLALLRLRWNYNRPTELVCIRNLNISTTLPVTLLDDCQICHGNSTFKCISIDSLSLIHTSSRLPVKITQVGKSLESLDPTWNVQFHFAEV